MDSKIGMQSVTRHNLIRKCIQGLRPIDDIFMRKIFQDQAELTLHTLQLITGIEDLVLEEHETQRDIKHLEGARSVALDVYATDNKGTKYNLEVQRSSEGADVHRARYHSSCLDIESLEASQPFSALPETYIIFVTEYDLFGSGDAVYHFVQRDSVHDLALRNGQHIIYANASYQGSDKVGGLLRDFLRSNPDEMETPLIAERVRYLKQTPKEVKEMDDLLEKWFAPEIERVQKESEARAIRSLMDSMHVSAQEAMRLLKVPADKQEYYLSVI